jgi:hypothetical protein
MFNFKTSPTEIYVREMLEESKGLDIHDFIFFRIISCAANYLHILEEFYTADDIVNIITQNVSFYSELSKKILNHFGYMLVADILEETQSPHSGHTRFYDDAFLIYPSDMYRKINFVKTRAIYYNLLSAFYPSVSWKDERDYIIKKDCQLFIELKKRCNELVQYSIDYINGV